MGWFLRKKRCNSSAFACHVFRSAGVYRVKALLDGSGSDRRADGEMVYRSDC